MTHRLFCVAYFLRARLIPRRSNSRGVRPPRSFALPKIVPLSVRRPPGTRPHRNYLAQNPKISMDFRRRSRAVCYSIIFPVLPEEISLPERRNRTKLCDGFLRPRRLTVAMPPRFSTDQLRKSPPSFSFPALRYVRFSKALISPRRCSISALLLAIGTRLHTGPHARMPHLHRQPPHQRHHRYLFLLRILLVYTLVKFSLLWIRPHSRPHALVECTPS